MEQENYKNFCRCCCLFIPQPEKSAAFTEEVWYEMQELTQLEEIGDIAGIVCLRCCEKLREFISFKHEIIKAQQQQNSPMYTTPKLEDFRSSSSAVVQEISDVKEEPESFLEFNEYFMTPAKVEKIQSKPKKIKKRQTSPKPKRRRKDAPKHQE